MKKDIEWLKEEISIERKSLSESLVGAQETKVERIFNDGKEHGLIFASNKINQLDEPEVLSDKWIDDESMSVIDTFNNHRVAVPIEKLQNLLVPKQELPVIPKFVAEWIESRKNNYPFDVIGVYLRMNESFANEQTREVLSWIHESELNRGSFARAWLDGYTVEAEQKYYVLNNEKYFLLGKDKGHGFIFSTGGNSKLGSMERTSATFELTEQEIKDYDPRYWAFAKPIEELEV